MHVAPCFLFFYAIMFDDKSNEINRVAAYNCLMLATHRKDLEIFEFRRHDLFWRSSAHSALQVLPEQDARIETTAVRIRLPRLRHYNITFLVEAHDDREYRPMLMHWTIPSNGLITEPTGEDQEARLAEAVCDLELFGDEELFIFEATSHHRGKRADYIKLIDDSTPLVGATSLRARCRECRDRVRRRCQQRMKPTKSRGWRLRLLRKIHAHYKLYTLYAQHLAQLRQRKCFLLLGALQQVLRKNESTNFERSSCEQQESPHENSSRGSRSDQSEHGARCKDCLVRTRGALGHRRGPPFDSHSTGCRHPSNRSIKA